MAAGILRTYVNVAFLLLMVLLSRLLNTVCDIKIQFNFKANMKHINLRTFAFFWLLFGSPTANFEPLSRRKSHSPDVNHCAFPLLSLRSPGASQ